MGSQTLEILRQGVWASLTGGWFYDPHQSIFCNAVHLYLWLFLVFSPFVVYLYFSGNWLTWYIYCILTSLIILLVKLVNLALHRLYDRAQTISESNLKHQFFKITKETEPREDEAGIELKVMRNDGSRNSVEQAINEASEENSMLSMENVNSIIDLKADVHRKNSSESIELMFYPGSLISGGNSQQDQQSLAGSTSVSKSLRSNYATGNANSGEVLPKYLSVYPEHEPKSSGSSGTGIVISVPHSSTSTSGAHGVPTRQPNLLRKSSEEFKRRHQRRRLERQSSLDATAESSIVSKLLLRQQSDSHAIASTSLAARNESSFLHPQQSGGGACCQIRKSASTTANNNLTTTNASNQFAQRLHVTTTGTAGLTTATATTTNTAATSGTKVTRLQRHRSSETHDERLKQQNRGLLLSIHHAPNHHHPHGASSGALASGSSGSHGVGGMLDTSHELEMDMGGSANGVASAGAHMDTRVRTLQSWILGSSSDVFIEDDSYTKSDFSIEQLDGRSGCGNSAASRAAFLLQQQQQLSAQYPPHTQQHRFQPHHPTHQTQQHQQQKQHLQQQQHQHQQLSTQRKDCNSNSSLSALQLPVAGPAFGGFNAAGKSSDGRVGSGGGGGGGSGSGSGSSGWGGGGGGSGMKRRRHSNATALFKSGSSTAAATAETPHPPTVRRIKSAALEISCPRPSVSNLSPHPNSVEAISGQQQIKNPVGALLPPPSKCLMRNPHLNLCPKFGGSYGGNTGSGTSLNFGVASTRGSANALIEPAYAIKEQADERTSKALETTDVDVDVGVDVDVDDAVKHHDCNLASESPAITDADADVDEDDDDDDEVDDVPMRRRHKALGCSTAAAHSGESDVGDMLGDDDEFKDFDDNLEHILNDLQQTHNELDDLQASYNAAASAQACHTKANYSDEDEDDADTSTARTRRDASHSSMCEDAPPALPALRQRTHSTDSETDNNGSRSPLLSEKCWKQNPNAAARAAEKTMRMEISAVRQAHKQISAAVNLPMYGARVRHNARGAEADSGCPSSDCEQVSASSKDMLLAESEALHITALPMTLHESAKEPGQTARQDAAKDGSVDDEALPSGSKAMSEAVIGKSLGAIPKTIKYHKMDDNCAVVPTIVATSQEAQKRSSSSSGGGGSSERALLNASSSKAVSCTSSTSSISADSLSADIHKMLWLMHGGTVDDRGRPIAGISADGTPIAAQPHVVPPNMSTAHFQFYQEAIQALHNYPAAGGGAAAAANVGDITLSELHYIDALSRGSKQVSETGTGAVPSSLELSSVPPHASSGAGVSGASGASAHAPPIGVVVSSSVLSASHRATLSLMSAINGERQAARAAVRVGAASDSRAAVILNVGDQQLDSYCEYWRPACLLATEQPAVASRSYYKYRFQCGRFAHDFKIALDRLELLSLFDRDLHWGHVLLSVVLCSVVATFGAAILQLGYYTDLCAFLFCAVVASAQYSLVKSVQPDAASPVHGFNKMVAYSRAIYFSLCAGLLLLLERLRQQYEQQPSDPSPLASSAGSGHPLLFYGIGYSPVELTQAVLQLLYVLLLCFPVLFSLGLCPQVNTFLLYLLEQLDMHIFGGNATGSLTGAWLCMLRSLLGVSLLYGPLYAALAEGRGTQYIVFSLFCAMLIPLGYHLSRSASDFSHLWALVKHCIVSSYREDDDDELSAAADESAGGKKQKLPKFTKQSLENIEMSTLEHTSASKEQRAENEHEEDSHTQLTRKSSKSKASSLCSSSQTLAKTSHSSRKAILTAASSYASMALPENEEEAQNQAEKGHKAGERESSNNLIAADEAGANEQAAVSDDNSEKASTSSTTNAADMSTLSAGGMPPANRTNPKGHAAGHTQDADSDSPDPLPKKLQSTVHTRLKNDLVVSTLLGVVVFGLHCSTVFTVLQPDLNIVLYAITSALGLLLHYVIPQMRKHMPWLCFARPILRQREFGQFEVSHAPKVMWFEKVYIYLCLLERNVMFPLLVISALTADAQIVAQKFGVPWGTLVVAICALKFIRNAYSDPTNQYLIVLFTVLLFRADFSSATETFLIDYFFVSIAFRKFCDFLLKLQFIVTYIAPWQITWGSAFHAFAQPFSVPHSAMLFLQAALSAILSTPLNPFLGSAIFLTSYVRPIKFWERDYNTRRIDHSNTRLSSQLERDLGADDNNLNSIFYEHLTRSLQHSLCGDLLMGRWGNVNQGDCFVLASDYLNCLVHIIELGNGLCTFQMRGLEFRGTYCQQREVEAITEDVEDNDGCCCCDPGHLPRMLSANAMFSTRWLAWQVVAAQYVLEGYSISDNLASATLQVFEYRKVLITYYIKSIIYYVVKNPKLEQWLASGPIQEALQHTLSRQFVDLDPIFNYNLDEDFDFRAMGITRSSFCFIYLSWINFCSHKRKESQNPPTAATLAPNNTPSYNDSKSTPNLNSTANAQTAKSQSQQQLRTHPQKSATMSGSSTVNNHSSEHIASSQSCANISRQTSESAPGLSGVGLSLSYQMASGAHCAAPLDNNSLNNSSMTVTGATSMPTATIKLPRLTKAHPKLLRKEDSPNTGNYQASVPEEKPNTKLPAPLVTKDAPLVSLCLALGLLARRSLATASHSSLTGVEFFLHGLHALFKGDFRITSPRDEWVFADMELLHAVVAPAVKMALKLQQDHISNPDEFVHHQALYAAIDTCAQELVISHEADPVWRSAVLRGAPNLLALRHVLEDGADEYRIIRLTKRFLSFRVIKLNRECVRGLWAGQQQELIYLRNRNPERGSIQNAKQALRNIINSSCDQPIGYPIYVSPLTTSYADTHDQLREVIGGAITLESIRANVLNWWHHIRERCQQGCSSGSGLEGTNVGVPATCSTGGESGELAPVFISPPLYNTLTVSNFFGVRSSNVASLGGSDCLTAAMRSGRSVVSVKPTSTTLAQLMLNCEREHERDILRESRTGIGSACKIQTPGVAARGERERRATLPIASTSLGVVAATSGSTATTASQLLEHDGTPAAYANDMPTSSSPRYAKMSCSSGSLGIGSIITTPGDYPRKTKGPICMASTAAAISSDLAPKANEVVRKPEIELYKKVIIIDSAEVFDCLDLGRRVTWPSEEMRARGGRLSWKDWVPRAGMVGYVVHYWIPIHADIRFRSHVNRIVYLVEIGEHYVPVREFGVREYNQVVSTFIEAAKSETTCARRIPMQLEMDELQALQEHRVKEMHEQQHQQQHQRECLTPILGSSLESPTSQLAASSSAIDTHSAKDPKIKAVSSSSSEDDVGLVDLELQRREVLLNMLKMISERKDSLPGPSLEPAPVPAPETDSESESGSELLNDAEELARKINHAKLQIAAISEGNDDDDEQSDKQETVKLKSGNMTTTEENVEAKGTPDSDSDANAEAQKETATTSGSAELARASDGEDEGKFDTPIAMATTAATAAAPATPTANINDTNVKQSDASDV